MSYPYSTPNSALIESLKLEAHPEGGFFVQTDVVPNEVPSPFTVPEGKSRMLATQIYYLLTPASARGRMHLNLGATFHLHHAGRSKYTLMRPSSTPGEPPEIKHVVMGPNPDKGEVLQLFVEGGWWKASEIPEEDLKGDEERVGALISEVVVPGFHWEDHKFLSREELVKIYGGDENAEGVKLLEPYVKQV
ncbi:DUF985 and Cupin, RmlC-type domain protein [Pseudohyphozyma bogoriensis]|nr:DUF985 and Cupin, RmlC-type domain protein [Pseudohyphozyma bogoriensis]